MVTINMGNAQALLALASLWSFSAIEGCVDDSAGLSEANPAFTFCADMGGYCGRANADGKSAREFCCLTCSAIPVPETSLPSNLTEPVQLFLMSGQSECTGSAQSNDLKTHAETTGAYPLVYPNPNGSALVEGVQEGVWFAGFANTYDFFIAPMKAGNEKPTFGTEMGFGQRVHEATGAPVLVIKYCWGGSNTHTHWNPTTDQNRWDYAADNHTAAWLLENAPVDLSRKSSLFANQVYTARLATEALKAANIDYTWKGIVWAQGMMDKAATWDEYGLTEARLFDAMRHFSTRVWDLPIVDTGSSAQHNLRTGKAYTGQLVKGCNHTTIEFGGSSENPDGTCEISPSNGCIGVENGSFINISVHNHYGWDPGMVANHPELKPPGSSNKTFHWWINFGRNGEYNLHSDFDGMILKGRMLADAYILAFTGTNLPATLAAEDLALRYPWPMCARGTKPTSTHQCWMDHRTQQQAAVLCVPQRPPPGNPTYPPYVPPSTTTTPFRPESCVILEAGGVVGPPSDLDCTEACAQTCQPICQSSEATACYHCWKDGGYATLPAKCRDYAPCVAVPFSQCSTGTPAPVCNSSALDLVPAAPGLSYTTCAPLCDAHAATCSACTSALTSDFQQGISHNCFDYQQCETEGCAAAGDGGVGGQVAVNITVDGVGPNVVAKHLSAMGHVVGNGLGSVSTTATIDPTSGRGRHLQGGTTIKLDLGFVTAGLASDALAIIIGAHFAKNTQIRYRYSSFQLSQIVVDDVTAELVGTGAVKTSTDIVTSTDSSVPTTSTEYLLTNTADHPLLAAVALVGAFVTILTV